MGCGCASLFTGEVCPPPSLSFSFLEVGGDDGGDAAGDIMGEVVPEQDVDATGSTTETNSVVVPETSSSAL